MTVSSPCSWTVRDRPESAKCPRHGCIASALRTIHLHILADNAAQRRATIKDQIAQTTEQLQNATTDAEVQKLHGVLTSLNGDLASTDDEVNQAASSAMVQDIQNRNDQQKQIQALTEQQNAEFTEAISNYTAKFQLLNAPTVFPTP
jgi:SOS-response transcriptional repressor LexA